MKASALYSVSPTNCLMTSVVSQMTLHWKFLANPVGRRFSIIRPIIASSKMWSSCCTYIVLVKINIDIVKGHILLWFQYGKNYVARQPRPQTRCFLSIQHKWVSLHKGKLIYYVLQVLCSTLLEWPNARDSVLQMTAIFRSSTRCLWWAKQEGQPFG